MFNRTDLLNGENCLNFVLLVSKSHAYVRLRWLVRTSDVGPKDPPF